MTTHASVGECGAEGARPPRLGFELLAEPFHFALDLGEDDGVAACQTHRRPARHSPNGETSQPFAPYSALGAGGDEHRRTERGEQARVATHALVRGEEFLARLAAGHDPVMSHRGQDREPRPFDRLDHVEEAGEPCTARTRGAMEGNFRVAVAAEEEGLLSSGFASGVLRLQESSVLKVSGVPGKPSMFRRAAKVNSFAGWAGSAPGDWVAAWQRMQAKPNLTWGRRTGSDGCRPPVGPCRDYSRTSRRAGPTHP